MRLDGTVTDQGDGGWTAIIPVKALSQAKSRMPGGMGTAGALALAFFQDTLAAVRSCPTVVEVIVVTEDPVIQAWARDSACAVVSDAGHPGINAAARWADRNRGASGPTAVIVSDLPCLTSAALTEALDLARGYLTAFVADADGTGTTIWMAASGVAIDPSFGEDSRAAHVRGGAIDLVADHPDRAAVLAAARRDVDTGAALAEARALGIGPYSQRAISAPDRPTTQAEIMMTVATSDETTVTLVDESGTRRVTPWASATAAGLRRARPGQRLAAALDGTGEIAALRLP